MTKTLVTIDFSAVVNFLLHLRHFLRLQIPVLVDLVLTTAICGDRQDGQFIDVCCHTFYFFSANVMFSA